MVWILRLLVLALATLIGLVVAELGIRVALSDVSTTADNTSFFAERWRSRNPEQPNSLGYREREISRQPRGGVVRIAVIGDSIAYGQGIAELERFGNQLEARLNARGGGTYEVLNFGRPGAATADHIEILRKDVLPLEPDFILLQWYVNDVEGKDVSGRPHPWRLLPSDRVSGWLHEHSALYYVANQSWIRVQHAAGWVEDYPGYMRRRFDDPEGEDWRSAAAAFIEFFALCRERGIEAAAVLFPSLWSLDEQDGGLGFLLDRTLDVCAGQGIRCVDLRPAILELPRDVLWVNRLDSHPSAEVNRVAAERLLQTIRWPASPPPASEGSPG